MEHGHPGAWGVRRRSLRLASSSFGFSARRSDLSLWVDLASTIDRWEGGIDIELVDNQLGQVAIDLGEATAPLRRESWSQETASAL